MNMHEREPAQAACLTDVLRMLSNEDMLILSRNRVSLMHGDGEIKRLPVHYEGLNASIEKGDHHPGKRVEYEFFRAAMQLMNDESYIRKSPVYPIYRVVNHTSFAAEMRIIDVAELITREELPMYSSISSGEGGETEVLTADLTYVTKKLMVEVGRSPADSMVLDGGRIIECRRAVPSGQISSMDMKLTLPGIENDRVDPRGEAVLDLLQLNMAKAFEQSNYKNAYTAPGNVEVELRIGALPDMQAILLSMIDRIEAHGRKLSIHKEGASGEPSAERSVSSFHISVVSDDIVDGFVLAMGDSLVSTVYDAYTKAIKIFPELRH